MANTYIVSDSQFKPYTFDEMIKPALMYKQAYDTVEEGLNNLEILSAGIEDKLTDSDADKVYKEKYNNFNNQINSVADLLLSGNLNKAKKEANKLKTIYAKELNPINEAYTRKLEYQKTLQQLKAKEGIIVKPTVLSTSDFLNGNTPDLPDYYSLKDIEDSAKESSLSTAKRLHSVSDWTPEHGSSLISRVEKTGFNETEFNQAYSDFINFEKIINDDEVSQQRKNNAIIFASIYTSEMQKRNTEDFDGNDVEKEVQAVLNGMRKGLIGSTDVKTLQNPLFDKDAKDSNGKSNDVEYDFKLYDIKTDTEVYQQANINNDIMEFLKTHFKIEDGLVTGDQIKNVTPALKDTWNDYYNFFEQLAHWDSNHKKVTYYKWPKGIKESMDRGYITFKKKDGTPITSAEEVYKANSDNNLIITRNTTKINRDIKSGILRDNADALDVNHLIIPINNESDKNVLANNFQIKGIKKLYKTTYNPKTNKYETSDDDTLDVNNANFEKFNGFKIHTSDGSIMLSINGELYALPMEIYKNYKDLMDTIASNQNAIFDSSYSLSLIDEEDRTAYNEGTLTKEDVKKNIQKLNNEEAISIYGRNSNLQLLINNLLSEAPNYSFKN